MTSIPATPPALALGLATGMGYVGYAVAGWPGALVCGAIGLVAGQAAGWELWRWLTERGYVGRRQE